MSSFNTRSTIFPSSHPVLRCVLVLPPATVFFTFIVHSLLDRGPTLFSPGLAPLRRGACGRSVMLVSPLSVLWSNTKIPFVSVIVVYRNYRRRRRGFRLSIGYLLRSFAVVWAFGVCASHFATVLLNVGRRGPRHTDRSS
ncbi:hypothetical protein DFH07DRAFT_790524 [Mycena maculata]|uniref:Uncharacterized protein n=1 Tax=Mycena maculata TaxID=230809 RepID=A0AAD7KDC6_9AGAR|nr:hypothetical protein DFH07DRAFT_790524 [Mycena maculata]